MMLDGVMLSSLFDPLFYKAAGRQLTGFFKQSANDNQD